MNKKDLRKIFNNIDPIGIFFEDNLDEYDSEIEKFIEKVKKTDSIQQIYQILIMIFTDFFDKEIVKQSKNRISDLASDLYKYISGDNEIMTYTYQKGYKNKFQEKIIKRLLITPNWLIILIFSLLIIGILIVVAFS